MDPADLRRELERFDSRLALNEAWTPPSSWYTQRDVFELEMQTVFANNWLPAARMDQVRAPGAFVAGSVANEPYVVLRGEDGSLRAFYNVCRHHATCVAQGEGTATRLVCPYHGWTYALDGRLLRAPELGSVKGFDRDAFGLVPMPLTSWDPLVFVSLSGATRSLAADLAALRERLDAMRYSDLVFTARRIYTLKCNWKVFVDNYLDGGYHVATLHKGLAAQLDLETYRTEVCARHSIQSGRGAHAQRAANAVGRDFSQRIGDEVLYAWIYPNLMINRYGDMMDINWTIPLAHDRTCVVMDYYFPEAQRSDADLVKKSIAASDVVQREDVEICESVQRGLSSRAFDRGRYSARLEHAALQFHRLLAEDLRSGM